MMMLGREVRLPHEVVFGSFVSTNQYESVSTYGMYVIDLKNKMQKAHDVARDHLQTVAEKQWVRYDVNACFHNFRPSDLVWLLNETREVGVCSKLQPVFLGPYVVSKKTWHGELWDSDEWFWEVLCSSSW